MHNSLSLEDFYSHATQLTNSLAVQLEVQYMLLHPYSREQKLQQINLLRQKAASKENSNELRRRQRLCN